MDKIYEKTRYDNIYRHSKNLNYVIRHNGSTISKINNSKIYDIKIAKDYKFKLDLNIEKKEQHTNSYYFKDLWSEYIVYCKEIKKLAFNTLKKKKSIYDCYLSGLDKEKVNNLVKEDIAFFLNNLVATDKQKNTSLIVLKGFFTWCEEEKQIIMKKPTIGIKNFKTPKVEMKYWNATEFKKFMDYIKSQDSYSSHMIKILVLLGLYLGDRIGETRALTWDSINEEHCTIRISHSINYDPNSADYLSSTKTYASDRVVDVSTKLIKELKKYKEYLQKRYITLNNLIFYNYSTQKPYSDSNLRKHFNAFCKSAEVKKIRLYDLRHTYVALMMSEGWELYHISKRIGHINYSTTVDKYGHLENKIRKEVAMTTDKYL